MREHKVHHGYKILYVRKSRELTPLTTVGKELVPKFAPGEWMEAPFGGFMLYKDLDRAVSDLLSWGNNAVIASVSYRRVMKRPKFVLNPWVTAGGYWMKKAGYATIKEAAAYLWGHTAYKSPVQSDFIITWPAVLPTGTVLAREVKVETLLFGETTIAADKWAKGDVD